jgi:hypothetical protein
VLLLSSLSSPSSPRPPFFSLGSSLQGDLHPLRVPRGTLLLQPSSFAGLSLVLLWIRVQVAKMQHMSHVWLLEMDHLMIYTTQNSTLNCYWAVDTISFLSPCISYLFPHVLPPYSIVCSSLLYPIKYSSHISLIFESFKFMAILSFHSWITRITVR